MIWYGLTYVFLNFLHFVYVFGQALVGSIVGAKVEEVSVGQSTVMKRGRFSWGLIPLSGYTKFMGDDEKDLPANRVEGDHFNLSDLSCWARLMVFLIGPISSLCISVVAFSIPVQLQSQQIIVDSEARWLMRYSEVESNWEGQQELISDWPIAVINNLRNAEPKGERPDPVPFQYGGWWTTMGMVALVFGLINLLPIPASNGFHILLLVWEIFFGPPSERVVLRMTYISLAIIIGLFTLIVYCDFSQIQ